MPNQSSNNKRIAKNTIALYLRMLFTMGVSLYTSRVILNTLGVEDFGIYNVTGGVIAMFGFINSAMSSATQRYITFELGKGDSKRLSSIFSTSLQIHILIAFLIFVLGETIGLWFLCNKLVIPDVRMDAAMWVYQCSILSSMVSIVYVPFNADIIAHEKMSAFAYISVFEAFLKLGILYILIFSPVDKLKLYAVLLLLVQLLICGIYTQYCARHFKESHYKSIFNKTLFKEMTGFAGWNFFGNFASVLYNQGLNIMLNIYFGPVVNAARGIVIQVQSAVQLFVGNFQMALNPQITKTYAVGEYNQMYTLIYRSARFSFLLMYLICLPVILESNFILTLWLKTVPDYTVVFMRLIIAITLIYTIANPCMIANQATGNVKVYQSVVGGLLLLILPISYIALILGAPAYSVFIVHFFIECVAQFSRLIMLKKLIKMPIRNFLNNVYRQILLVVVFSSIMPIFVYLQMEDGLLRFLSVGFTSVISVSLASFFLGLSKHERAFMVSKVSQRINFHLK